MYEQARSAVSAEAAEGDEPAASGMPQDETAPEIDFAALRETNPEVVGWIFAEEGTISYPVVQGEDNDYYLTHLFNGEQNKLGSIFMDYRSSGDFSDQNTVLYGHNMKDGSMFSSLINYEEQSYYDDHPTMTLYTPEGAYTVELFAGVLTDADSEFIRRVFDGGDFQEYLDLLREKSTFQGDVPIGPEDRIVTLCTCSYKYDDARYLLCGKLTPRDVSSAE